jgi:cobalamin biosynthesis protein CbiG
VVLGRFSWGAQKGGSVKDIHEVLRQKENDCARVQAEIEALRVVIPLLAGEQPASPIAPESEQEDNSPRETTATGTEGPSFSTLAASESGFWRRRHK